LYGIRHRIRRRVWCVVGFSFRCRAGIRRTRRGPAARVRTDAEPPADTIKGSQYSNMKELRVQHEGRPYRILFAFDPRRTGLLLIGGDKTGNNRWYEEFVPKADAVFTEHLRELERE